MADYAAATERFALQLSGHTHGGQIRLPLITRLALSGFVLRHSAGLFRVKNMLLYVNRGIGTVGLPLRINCRSELTLITLKTIKGRGYPVPPDHQGMMPNSLASS